MFFMTYLRRELLRRKRQAVVVALGLAVGVGLVITVIAASDGVTNAQAGVLRSLYGIGTDATVTKAAKAQTPGSGKPPAGAFVRGPNGICVYNAAGVCKPAAGQTIDNLSSPTYAAQPTTTVAKIAALHGVSAAAGGMTLTDTKLTVPTQTHTGPGGGPVNPPTTFEVAGVDLKHTDLGPLSSGKLTKGRSLAGSDSNAKVAVVDSGYAAQNKLKVNSTVTIAGTKFTVVGLVSQPQGSNPPNVYIPLTRAQDLATYRGNSMKNEINTIYVSVANSGQVGAVQNEIKALLPKDTVTTSADLASQVSGSLASTAKLANDLGRWLSVLVLIAAFAVAALLTMAAVSRRVREFGTLKALGWRSRRIMAQVLGESITMGILGGAAGVAIGFGGAKLITKIAPKLYATVFTSTGQHLHIVTAGGASVSNPTIPHKVAVPLIAAVSGNSIVLAVVLAVGGGLIAGLFGSWRIAQLRPAAALARVE
jgi:putative ABC transport system permease protein